MDENGKILREALLAIDKEFIFVVDNKGKLNWLDPKSKPTQKVIDAKIKELEEEKEKSELRKELISLFPTKKVNGVSATEANIELLKYAEDLGLRLGLTKGKIFIEGKNREFTKDEVKTLIVDIGKILYKNLYILNTIDTLSKEKLLEYIEFYKRGD